jgi:hypothetical protein
LNWTGLFPVHGPSDEYAVLVTSLTEEILTLAQLYRDRADMENNFDELKNQWGWGGFVTKDLLRCQIAARSIALIYNWWSLFVRLADPSKRREAITSPKTSELENRHGQNAFGRPKPGTESRDSCLNRLA